MNHSQIGLNNDFKFWPYLRLAVLTAVVIIQKKRASVKTALPCQTALVEHDDLNRKNVEFECIEIVEIISDEL